MKICSVKSVYIDWDVYSVHCIIESVAVFVILMESYIIFMFRLSPMRLSF